MADQTEPGHESAAELAANVAALLTDITGSDLSLDDVLKIACEHAQRVTKAGGAVIEMADGEWMLYRSTTGSLTPFVGMRIRREQSLSGMTMTTGTTQLCLDTETDPRVDRAATSRTGIRSMILVPLKHGDMAVGVLKVVWAVPEGFGQEAVRSLRLLGGVLAIAIRRSEEVDARLHAQQSLRASEARWRSVVEQSIAGIYLVEGERFTYANDRFLEMLGYTLPELVALPSSLIPVDEIDRELVRNNLSARAAGEITSGGHVLRCSRRDGTPVILQVFSSAIPLEKGQGVIGTVIDVTERHRTDERLRSSEEWFRTLIEGASDMIGVLTIEGVYTYVSPSVREQLGYEPDHLVGRNAFDLIHQDDLERVKRELEKLLASSISQTGTRLRFRHATLGWRMIDVRVRLLQSSDGKRQLIVNSRDITEQVALQTQVADAERLASLGRVASSMAHEFNNVLMGIQPFADVISRTTDTERLARATKGIQNAVRRGRTITQQVLRFTRGEKPVRRSTPAALILRSVSEQMASQLPGGIRLEVRVVPEDLRVLADADQVEQTLVNLALNSRDAMPDGGNISISARPAEKREHPYGVLPDSSERFVQITVTDQGMGIAPELLARIFEPLFTTKKTQGGSGLGLTIAQQIATAHQGALFAESTPGTGTSFHLFLPVATAVPVVSEGPPADLPAGVNRILLVEDDDLVADAVMAALSALQINTHRVSTGGAAAGGVTSFEPDVVLLDYGLPDMSGTDVYRVLRARWPKLPIVFATGHADAVSLRKEVGDANVQIFFKPFEISRLLAVLAQVVVEGLAGKP